MNAKDSIEITAASIDEAINQALAELGAAEDDVVIEVLSTPRAGVLGLGQRQARVRVTRRTDLGAHSAAQSPPPAPVATAAPAAPPRSDFAPARAARLAPEGAPPPASMPRPETPARDESEDGASDLARREVALDEQAREAASVLSQILEQMGEKAEVIVGAIDPEAIEIEIKGDGSGILIGRHGQTLDALEYLLNRLVARRIKDAVSVVIDTESYRARRRSQLERMALSMGERAKREHTKMVLEPMPPRDRRVIHLALKDDPLITTRSTGEGYMRTVEILPAEGRHERERGGGGRGRYRERERESEAPIGQQGGFKHGQKRIV